MILLNVDPLVVYKFDDVEDHLVLVQPHGNSRKSNQPYRRTKQSTKNLLDAELSQAKPKDAIDKVFTERGGMMAESAGNLPRDRTQAYNLKKKQQQIKLTSFCGISGMSLSKTHNMLYVVMEQYKCAKKKLCKM